MTSRDERDVRVTVVSEDGQRTPIIGVTVGDLPDDFEPAKLPEVGDNGQAHYATAHGTESHCLPECWCQR